MDGVARFPRIPTAPASAGPAKYARRVWKAAAQWGVCRCPPSFPRSAPHARPCYSADPRGRFLALVQN